jgi:small subunit ribosomal protein S20
MPIKTSAKKYMRVTGRKTAINKKIKIAFRGAIKQTVALIKTQKSEEAKTAYISAQKALDKAAKKGIIKANTAARKKSRLVKMIKAIK